MEDAIIRWMDLAWAALALLLFAPFLLGEGLRLFPPGDDEPGPDADFDADDEPKRRPRVDGFPQRPAGAAPGRAYWVDPPGREDAEEVEAFEEGKTLGDWRSEHEWVGMEPARRWAECPCCGCPTIDTGEDFPECGVCAWDGDVAGLQEARGSFAAYGCACTPDECAALGRPLPSEDELRIIRDVASRCAAAADPDRAPPAEFWTELGERLAALGAARRSRPAAADSGRSLPPPHVELARGVPARRPVAHQAAPAPAACPDAGRRRLSRAAGRRAGGTLRSNPHG